MTDRETVVVIRASNPGKDAKGDPLPSTDTRTDVPGCVVAPGSSEEPVERGRDSVLTSWTVYAPRGTDVRATDDIEIRGVRCRIVGDPDVWDSTPGGVVITAKAGRG